jgi:hypothetical protein
MYRDSFAALLASIAILLASVDTALAQNPFGAILDTARKGARKAARLRAREFALKRETF